MPDAPAPGVDEQDWLLGTALRHGVPARDDVVRDEHAEPDPYGVRTRRAEEPGDGRQVNGTDGYGGRRWANGSGPNGTRTNGSHPDGASADGVDSLRARYAERLRESYPYDAGGPDSPPGRRTPDDAARPPGGRRARADAPPPNGANPYGSDRYGPEPYGSDRYGSEPYGADRYGPERYDSNPYGSDRYGSDPRGGNRYGAGRAPNGAPRTGGHRYGVPPGEAELSGEAAPPTDRQTRTRGGRPPAEDPRTGVVGGRHEGPRGSGVPPTSGRGRVADRPGPRDVPGPPEPRRGAARTGDQPVDGRAFAPPPRARPLPPEGRQAPPYPADAPPSPGEGRAGARRAGARQHPEVAPGPPPPRAPAGPPGLDEADAGRRNGPPGRNTAPDRDVEPGGTGPPGPDVPGRRRRPPARPDPEADEPDTGAPSPEPEDDATPADPAERDQTGTDDPRVGKRSGPAGIAGRIAALTGRGSGEKRQMSFWKELPLLIGVALVLTFLIQTFLAKVYVIPSGSMETTLHGCSGCNNDRVLVDKVTYNFADITPGDVVVFKGPDSWSSEEYTAEKSSNPLVRGLETAGSLIGFAPPDEKDFVKRVIATGGQTVACCDALNQVMVDGQPLEEPYTYYTPEAGPARQVPFGPVKVPEGELWLMGDSRNNSADSRAAGHGPVPEENVIGKVRLIVLPFDRFGWVSAIDPQGTASAAGAPGAPDGLPLALGMMGTLPLAASRRLTLRARADAEWFLPATRPRNGWRRTT